MLEKFREAKREEIERLIRESSRGEASELPAFSKKKELFSIALKKKRDRVGHAVIAEYKRASPSKGDINLTLMPDEAAHMYAAAGASAISVLTESQYFGGQLEFLEGMSGAGLPLLRKDFIFHPLQVEATAKTAASALLVIVRMLDEDSFKEIIDACQKVGLEPVVEVFSKEDLNRAQSLNVEIIQVNNRDLETLKTDFEISRQLIPYKRAGELWISASGYESRTQIDAMGALGFDAFLVGTSLMSEDDPGHALAGLTGK